MRGRPDTFWASLPFGRGVTVLAHDPNGVAALSKPVGILSHPNSARADARALLAAPYDLEAECYHGLPGGAPPAAAPRRLWLLNRLDSATSGVILVAADGDVAAAVREQFKRREVRKVYQALVFGRPPAAPAVWRDRLAVKRAAGRIRAGTGHIPSECRVRVVQTGRGEPALALLRLEPMTGRSHQLRVQCAERGLPIVGDQTYGDFRRNRDFARATGSRRLFLHALETGFSYEFGGRQFAFAARAPLPPEFAAASEQV